MKVLQLFAERGGDKSGELRESLPGESGERGDLRLPKRWDRMLVPGEVGSGVLGMPWLESGRKNLPRLDAVVEAEFGGDWPASMR